MWRKVGEGENHCSTNRAGFKKHGGADLMLLPQPMEVGACLWQVGVFCWLKGGWRG